jgi:hypothetical protein
MVGIGATFLRFLPDAADGLLGRGEIVGGQNTSARIESLGGLVSLLLFHDIIIS